MKKIILGVCCMCVAFMFESCYSSTVCVGKFHPQEDAKCVGTSHNAHFIGGLIGSKKIRAKKYVENLSDYKIKTYHSFGDCIISGITLSIYTPTTTKFYVNEEGMKKLKKQHKNNQ